MTEGRDRQRATAALEEGEKARMRAHGSLARRAFAEAAAYFREHGSRPELAHALTRCAQIERDLGAKEAAIAFQTEAVAIYRNNDDPRLAHALRHLADMLAEAERIADAAPLSQEMLALYRAGAAKDDLDMANAVRSAAIQREAQGDLLEARILWLEAIDRYSALTDILGPPHKNPGVLEAQRRLGSLSL